MVTKAVRKMDGRPFLLLLRTEIRLLLLLLVLAAGGFICPGRALASQGDDAGSDLARYGELITLDQIPGSAQIGGKTVKAIPLVAFVIEFDNYDYEDSYDWHEMLFGTGKTLQQYYLDMSCQQMTYVPAQEQSVFGRDGNTCVHDQLNDGIIHIHLPYDTQFFCSSGETEMNGIGKVKLMGYALDQVTATAGIDLRAYDRDGNGSISGGELMILFIVSGYEEAMKSKIDLSLLPENATLVHGTAGYTDSDAGIGLRFEAKLPLLAEKMYKDGESVPEMIGFFVHELGHSLGLMDMYRGDIGTTPDSGWGAYQPDYLSLMGAGNYGQDMTGGDCPFSLDIWSRCLLGWLEPVLLRSDENAGLASSLSSNAKGQPQVLRINTSRKGEYFLLENRQFESWDKGMKRFFPDQEGGIIIWHIDEDIYEYHYNKTNGGSLYPNAYRPPATPLFLELNEDGEMTLIGRKVLHQYPFFNQEIQEKVHTDTNGYLNLPVYKENLTSSPEKRTLSCIGLKFTSGSGKIMHVKLKEENHTWDEGILTKEASVDEEGEKTFTCIRCGAVRTEKIPCLEPTAQAGTEEPQETEISEESNQETADPPTSEDGTALGKGASAASAEAAILSMTSDADPAGSHFAPLRLKSSKQTKKTVTISWKKVSGAAGYVIYGNKCGRKNQMEKLARTTGTKKTFKKILGKKVKKCTYYKFLVLAIDKDDKVISASKIVHACTKGGKSANVKKVTTRAKKNTVTMRAGKSFKLKAKAVPVSKKKKVKKHRSLQYESTDPSVAAVSKTGVVKAVGKGKCYVYAFAQNGVYKKIRVNVK